MVINTLSAGASNWTIGRTIGFEILEIFPVNGASFSGIFIRAWTNDKCLATKHHQTLFGDQTYYRLDTLFGAV